MASENGIAGYQEVMRTLNGIHAAIDDLRERVERIERIVGRDEFPIPREVALHHHVDY